MEFKDYYKILGVTPETPTDDIKRAYRKLARQYHPDVSKLSDAEQRFKEINEAWEVLKDDQKRKHYDQLRAGGWHPGQPEFTQAGGNGYRYEGQRGFSPEEAADFSEFFNSIFGGGAGFGERGRHSAHFRHKGQDFHVKVRISLQEAYRGGVKTLQLQMPSQTPKNAEPQTKLNVKIPAGVVQGSQIRLKEQGGEGIGGGR